VPESEDGPRAASREGQEQSHPRYAPAAGAQDQHRGPEHGEPSHRVENEDDPPPAREEAGGLQARGCRKRRDRVRRSRCGSVETVAHAFCVPRSPKSPQIPRGASGTMTGGGGNMMAAATGGKAREARALWYVGDGRVELRAASLPPLGPGEARVRTLYSGISRGTERLVFQGAIARSEWERMRCPMQDGAVPVPVKYGYFPVRV